MLEPSVELSYALKPSRCAYLQLARGTLLLNGLELNAGDAAKIAELQTMHLQATSNAEVLLFDLPLMAT